MWPLKLGLDASASGTSCKSDQRSDQSKRGLQPSSALAGRVAAERSGMEDGVRSNLTGPAALRWWTGRIRGEGLVLDPVNEECKWRELM